MADEHVWKQRFLIFTLVRLFGLGMVVLGVLISSTDLLRVGGWPTAGFIIAAMGLIDAVFAPRLLKKAWEEQDRQRP